MLLEIAKIKATPEAQPRVSLHYPTVEEYAEALRGDAEFPPLIVFFDGADYWLADGFHRLEAYKMCGYVEVPVDVRKGSKRDAILFSVGANSKHGLQRTNEDKRRAVTVLLSDPEWRRWTDQQIAEAAGVGREFVNRLRREIAPPTCDQTTGSEKRLGRDGKWRRLPQRTSGKSRPMTADEVGLIGDLAQTKSVYVLQRDTLIKVGWSRHPMTRVGTLLSEHPDATIVAIAPGEMAHERAVHKMLECERQVGEWFITSLEDVLTAMRRCGLSPRRDERLRPDEPNVEERRVRGNEHSTPPMREGCDGRVCKLPHQKQAEPAEEESDGSAADEDESHAPAPPERQREVEPASERRETSRGDVAPTRQSRVDGVTVPAGDDPALYSRTGYSRRESREIDENVMQALDVAVTSLRDDDWERLMRRIDMKRLERPAA